MRKFWYKFDDDQFWTGLLVTLLVVFIITLVAMPIVRTVFVDCQVVEVRQLDNVKITMEVCDER